MNVSNQMNEPNSNLDLEEDFSILSNNDEPNRSVYEFWKQFDLKKLQVINYFHLMKSKTRYNWKP